MIFDGILFVIKGIVNILLAPLEIINFAVDLVVSIPVVSEFLGIIAYVLPWNNLLPLFYIIFAIIGFKIGISAIKTIWNLLPFA